jgi:hypothetical protein
MPRTHIGGLAASGLVALVLLMPAAPAAQTRVNPDAKALVEFMEKVKDYVALHEKLEGTLTNVPKQASSQQLDDSQRALARLMQQARPGAKQGDLFIKEVRSILRRQLARVFEGPDGKDLKEAVMEENAGPIKLRVNGRYPDNVPLSTVPSQVLEALPKLPAELEYRFVGRRLILFDEHAHLVADVMDDAIPR